MDAGDRKLLSRLGREIQNLRSVVISGLIWVDKTGNFSGVTSQPTGRVLRREMWVLRLRLSH